LLLYRLYDEAAGCQTVRARIIDLAVHRHAENEAESILEPGLHCLVRCKSINMSGEAVYQTVFLGPEARPEDLAWVSYQRQFFGTTCVNTRAELINDFYQAQAVAKVSGPKASSEHTVHVVGLGTL
jgi:hypothetical protein